MLKFAFATILVTGLAAAAPAYAEPSSGSTIGRGCTLDPFTHTMRCIDFDKCTTDKNGKRTCPVVVTPMNASVAKGKGKKADQQEFLVVRLNEVLVSSY